MLIRGNINAEIYQMILIYFRIKSAALTLVFYRAFCRLYLSDLISHTLLHTANPENDNSAPSATLLQILTALPITPENSSSFVITFMYI